MSRRLAEAESSVRSLPVDAPVEAPTDEPEVEDELDGVMFCPLPPSTPLAPLVSPIALSSPSTLSDSASPPPRAFPARGARPPPPPPPKASGSAALSPKIRATSPTSALRSRARPSRSFGAANPPPTTVADPLLPPPSSGTGNLLEHHASLQQALLGDLTSMSSQLKTNSQAFAHSLEKDKEVVLAAQDKLDGNLTVMKKEGGRLGGYGKKATGMVWVTVGLVGAVAAIWVGMFLLIKVT